MNFNLQDFKKIFYNTDKLLEYGNILFQIIVIIVAVKIFNHFGRIIIDRFFDKQKKSRFGFNDRKCDTLSELLKSILKYVLYIIGILTILDALGFKTGTLLLGAGLSGIAIGFGAQNLIKDIISGFLIIFEDQFSVGEYITIDDMSGFVEAVGLRITRLKDYNGDLHIIPNGSISKVTNHSRDNSMASVKIRVGYDANIDRVIEVLNGICNKIKMSNSDIIDGPSVLGITQLYGNSTEISISAKTKPLKQFSIEMQIRKNIIDSFKKEGIDILFPSCVIIKDDGNN